MKYEGGKLDLSRLVLKRGSHDADAGEFCVMEATAADLGLPHSDRDVDAVCPRIEAYARSLNDWLLGPQFTEAQHDYHSARLVPFIRRLPNTKGTAKQDTQRRWMLQEFAMRCAASAMEAANLPEQAKALRDCLPIADQVSSDKAAARAAEAAEAAGAAWAVWAAEAARAGLVDDAFDLLDRLCKVTGN